MFLRAMATLPIRPGALSNPKAGDFDARLMALKIKDKTGQRTIKLPSKSPARRHCRQRSAALVI